MSEKKRSTAMSATPAKRVSRTVKDIQTSPLQQNQDPSPLKGKQQSPSPNKGRGKQAEGKKMQTPSPPKKRESSAKKQKSQGSEQKLAARSTKKPSPSTARRMTRQQAADTVSTPVKQDPNLSKEKGERHESEGKQGKKKPPPSNLKDRFQSRDVVVDQNIPSMLQHPKAKFVNPQIDRTALIKQQKPKKQAIVSASSNQLGLLDSYDTSRSVDEHTVIKDEDQVSRGQLDTSAPTPPTYQTHLAIKSEQIEDDRLELKLLPLKKIGAGRPRGPYKKRCAMLDGQIISQEVPQQNLSNVFDEVNPSKKESNQIGPSKLLRALNSQALGSEDLNQGHLSDLNHQQISLHHSRSFHQQDIRRVGQLHKKCPTCNEVFPPLRAICLIHHSPKAPFHIFPSLI
ncbi:hypothetical protein FGO68_gene2463 [Halteria grandinella]|uniref:Uncharacterized protein n=1 Tax=Halteria grandinella TaxID=5974 RepID=A0A8J8T8L3_HALGN|nr:hypothetical protein FGO68_gene2463 [Halteria grandinella]